MDTLIASPPDARDAIRALTYADEATLVRDLTGQTRLDAAARQENVRKAAALVTKVRERSSPTVMEAFLV
jgi:hypothetical protein